MAGFLNKVVAGVSAGVANVGANASALVEKAKIKTAISNLENECTDLMKVLGQKTYDLYKSTGSVNADEKFTNIISELDKRKDAITLQQEALKRVEEELATATGNTAEGEVACPSCGHVNRAGAKFCAGCGGAVKAAE
jgi:chaperonin cofactor prefoldin